MCLKDVTFQERRHKDGKIINNGRDAYRVANCCTTCSDIACSQFGSSIETPKRKKMKFFQQAYWCDLPRFKNIGENRTCLAIRHSGDLYPELPKQQQLGRTFPVWNRSTPNWSSSTLITPNR
mmetsp:Transcript_10102/g.12132  ORF Transcript_10102/g.12132 Transcript_10102/m.12132 type:complete len:122 (+) Transcript_10102:472-837(+)